MTNRNFRHSAAKRSRGIPLQYACDSPRDPSTSLRITAGIVHIRRHHWIALVVTIANGAARLVLQLSGQ
jgi:hypothetical protein